MGGEVYTKANSSATSCFVVSQIMFLRLSAPSLTQLLQLLIILCIGLGHKIRPWVLNTYAGNTKSLPFRLIFVDLVPFSTSYAVPSCYDTDRAKGKEEETDEKFCQLFRQYCQVTQVDHIIYRHNDTSGQLSSYIFSTAHVGFDLVLLPCQQSYTAMIKMAPLLMLQRKRERERVKGRYCAENYKKMTILPSPLSPFVSSSPPSYDPSFSVTAKILPIQ